MINWEEIRKEYETTDISLTELADKYDIKYPTIKSRRQRQGWAKDASKVQKDASHTKDASKSKGGAPKGNRNAAGHGAPKGNKNAVGNAGGAGGPLRNDKAVTHGFFRKFLPDDTIEIMEEIETRSPLDMLWDQITIQYAAILRAQQIMFVKDRDDSTTTKIEEKGGNVWGEKWEVQQAWDKQANFLSAQSRAMGELRSLIKSFLQLSDESDERRLKLISMQLDIDKKKLEVKEMRGDDDGDAHAQGSGYAEALNAQASDVFADEVDHGEEA